MNAYRTLVIRPEERSPVGRPRRMREDNIKKHLKAMGWGVVCTGLIWLRIGTNGNEHSGSIKL
jgi:hypothetical protein